MHQVEEAILLFVQENVRIPVLDAFFSAFTRLGDHGILWILISLGFLLVPKTRKAGLCCSLALIIMLLLNNLILKPLVGRIRPYEVIPQLRLLVPPERSFSFPSGHACSAFAAATAAWLSLPEDLPRKLGIPLLILAALLAVSRIYVAVHYPTDVIFGSVEGILLGYAGEKAGTRLWAKIKEKKTP